MLMLHLNDMPLQFFYIVGICWFKTFALSTGLSIYDVLTVFIVSLSMTPNGDKVLRYPSTPYGVVLDFYENKKKFTIVTVNAVHISQF